MPTRPFDSGRFFTSQSTCVRVGGIIDRSRVERAAQRPRHHVLTL